MIAIAITIIGSHRTAAAIDATPAYGGFGIDLSAILSPGNDFFTFVNGGWLERTPIPPSEPMVARRSKAWSTIEQRLKQLLEEQARQSAVHPSSDAAKLGAYYQSFMDEDRIESLGTGPLEPHLAGIRAIITNDGAAMLMGRAGLAPSLFAFDVAPDLRNPGRNAAQLTQSGLILSLDRDIYLDPQETEIRSALRDYAAEILAWIGWPEPSYAAESIVAFEKQVAQLHWTPAESRDSERTYNPMSPEELVQAAPRFPWHSYLSALGLTDQDRIIVREKSAVFGLATLFSNTPLDTVKAWLAFRAVHSASPFLPRRFDEAAFALDGYTTGQQVQRSRWQRAVEQIAGRFSPPGSFADPATMNEALGTLYLAQYFQDDTRQKATAIVSAVRDAFRLRLERAEWLSPETRTKAIDKLDRYEVMVGGRAQPPDYSTLVIRSDDLLGNVVRMQLFARAVKLDDLHRPVDRSRWEMSAYTKSPKH